MAPSASMRDVISNLHRGVNRGTAATWVNNASKSEPAYL
jgi:hypothetical protein